MDKSRRSPWKVLSGLWSNYSFIFIFVVIFLAYYLVSPHLTWTGITNILRHSADVGIIALGMGLVVITGQIDLSVGSMLAFVGGCTIMVYNVTNSILLAFLAAVVCGTVCGLINGILVGRAKMPAFIATLATMLIYRSLTRYICSEIPTTLSGGSNSLFKLMRGDKIVSALKLHEGTDMYKVFYNFGNGKFLGLPVTGIFLLMITIVIVYVTTSTKYGKSLYAVGSNERAARLCGINVDRCRVSVFAITGLLTGISAFLWIGMNASIDPATTGSSYEMYAIAAVVLGGINMAGGRGRCIGILFGVMSYTIIDKIIVSLKLNTQLNDTVKGAILIIAILIQTVGPMIRESLRARRVRRQMSRQE